MINREYNNEIENNPQNNYSKNRREEKHYKRIVVIIILTIVFGTLTKILFDRMIRVGATYLADSYNHSYETEKEETYKKKYESYKENAERKHHVSNRVNIYLENIQESQKLEVLKVSDVEYIINNKEDNKGNIVSWLEVPGEGTFVVDLKAGEYVIDNEHNHVSVRVPYPELTNVKIDYSNVNKILFKDDLFNGSYKEGEDLARQQLGEPELLIRKEFTSNQNYYISAQNSARTIISNLIKQLNPDNSELSVDVEFY